MSPTPDPRIKSYLAKNSYVFSLIAFPPSHPLSLAFLPFPAYPSVSTSAELPNSSSLVTSGGFGTEREREEVQISSYIVQWPGVILNEWAKVFADCLSVCVCDGREWAHGSMYRRPVAFLDMQKRGRERGDGTVIVGE